MPETVRAVGLAPKPCPNYLLTFLPRQTVFCSKQENCSTACAEICMHASGCQDQGVFNKSLVGACRPDVTVRYTWHMDNSTVTMTLAQTQGQDSNAHHLGIDQKGLKVQWLGCFWWMSMQGAAGMTCSEQHQ